MKGQYPGKNGRGNTSITIIKAFAINTGADGYRAVKEWLAAVPDGKLPASQPEDGRIRRRSILCYNFFSSVLFYFILFSYVLYFNIMY